MLQVIHFIIIFNKLQYFVLKNSISRYDRDKIKKSKMPLFFIYSYLNILLIKDILNKTTFK